ncbi:NAD(P)H-dependent oxidoreductase [Spongiibacter nanhainus]|uniref:NAD(P)H-dependent oxidoreductase n=1 Tax=Spongiibacter nanhainus TaxID=2794344 RepID=A0A7T4R2I9_9GAMM|nr:NAD(P)H-dependent oxidoreductase [Spongiibacter nanhainus]QQD19269.1 NAD(P)H-dependent oxidoreductase [Spongiibacter nanhainus]
MKILSFAASNSRYSINRQLLDYAEGFVSDTVVEHLDIHDYEMPIYSIDREQASGIPQQAKDFLDKIAQSNGLLISFAEHNGNYTAAFKNIFDWCSRAERNIYQNKAIAMLSTSPGPGGGGRVLDLAVNAAPFFGGNVVASLSIANFNDNFDSTKGELKNPDLQAELKDVINKLLVALR